MKFHYLRNYLYIFITSYFIVLSTKILFFFYLSENFKELDTFTSFQSIIWGYKFDLATTSIVSFIATLFDFHKKTLSIVASTLLTVLFLTQISDIMYFYESSRHMGYEVSDAIADGFGLFMTALSQHTFLSLFGLIFGLIFFIFSLKTFNNFLVPVVTDRYYLLKKISLIIITVFFVRGMTQSIPLNPWQSNQIGDNKLAILALNGSYNTIFALVNKNTELKPMQLPKVDERIVKETLKKLYQSNYTPYSTNLKQPNIVIFYLESWSAVNIKSYGFDKSSIAPTPFFDEILKQSIRPKAMIAGGHRTTEGIFASLCSYQNPLGKTIAKTRLQDYDYPSLIKILNQNGYCSAFFQGSSKETSGTGSFVQSLGFSESYGKRDVIKRVYEENYWGVHDTDLYQFVIDTLDKSKKPFVIGINGATTHDDKIPSRIQKINFVQDASYNNQLNALYFSDKALKNFIEEIEKKYPNTLFVFMADHCGGVKGSNFQNYMIPFAIYHKELMPKYYDIYLSQRDFAPTILDIVFGDYKKFTNNFTGKSLLSDSDFFADYYHNGILGWVKDNKAVEFNIATQDIKCYDVINFNNHEIPCNEKLKQFKDEVLSFTNYSQKLLFEGKFDNFKK